MSTRATNCEHECIGPFLAVKKSGRVWVSRKKQYQLPDDLSVSECTECGMLHPTRDELFSILSWLDVVAPGKGTKSVSLDAKVLGGADRKTSLGGWRHEWVKFKSQTTESVGRISGRRVEHTLRGGDRRVVSVIDQRGERWVGAEVDQSFGTWRWIFAPVSKFAWRSLLNGSSKLDDIFANSGTETEVVDYSDEGTVRLFATASYSHLPRDVKHLGAIPKAILADILSTMNYDSDRQRFAFIGGAVHGHAISMSGLNYIVNPISKMFSAVMRRLTAIAGSIAEPMFVAVEGSFGLELSGGNDSVFEEVWSHVSGIITDSADPEKLRRRLEADAEFADYLIGFLDGLRQSKLEMYLSSRSTTLHINPVRARRIASRIANAREKAEGPDLQVTGFFLGFSATVGGTFVFCSDDGRMFQGKPSKDVRDNYITGKFSIMMAQSAKYQATVRHATNGRRNYYLLVDAEPQDDGAKSPQNGTSPDGKDGASQ